MRKLKWILFSIVFMIALSALGCGPNSSNATTNGDEVLFTIEGAEKTELTRAEFMALEQCVFHISRTNSKGVTTTGDYSGVNWDVLCEAIGVPTDAESVTLIASDGFTQAYSMDVLYAEKSMFAIEKDGLPITEESENGQVWFCADESYTANYWTKFVTKIVIR